ncbi:hypothetical protein PoB_002569000 [Plakobranchus ocellatus]|uniref:Uncharacterized protein n=1 Tax=Plakobranchus ocellatus TaxID=259542 RepID=A0AAV3ZTM7_9GAST|nr:hypothetical protein PoB_002569000 [Plakobranchus ocellatus]
MACVLGSHVSTKLSDHNRSQAVHLGCIKVCDNLKFGTIHRGPAPYIASGNPAYPHGGVGSTVACESALRSAGTLLSRVRAPLPAPWPDGGPESLRSPCCGLAIYKKLKLKHAYPH